MHEIFAREPDPLEGMLGARPLPADAAALRQELLAQTARVLRRRRRGRQIAWAAALAACYIAGLLTMHRAGRPAPAPSPAPVAKTTDRVQQPRDVSPPTDGPERPALAKEWEAVESGRAGLFREAGDLYLDQEGDLASAVRCYRNALNAGTEGDLAISSQDNWLLMAIKDARQKEKRNAKNNG
jgi:hypothetical protein